MCGATASGRDFFGVPFDARSEATLWPRNGERMRTAERSDLGDVGLHGEGHVQRPVGRGNPAGGPTGSNPSPTSIYHFLLHILPTPPPISLARARFSEIGRGVNFRGGQMKANRQGDQRLRVGGQRHGGGSRYYLLTKTC